VISKSIIVKKTFYNRRKKISESILLFESQLPLFVASMCGPAGDLEYRENWLL
jgi:hypothetical protein